VTNTHTHTQGRLVDLLNTKGSPCVTRHPVEPLVSVAPH